ncbi:hypothetical protein P3S68_026932 [Capsicum galapagoense]
MFMRSPDLSYMRVFECLCHATNLNKYDKFGPRAIRLVLIGYGDTQKGYRLYDLENHTFFISKDMVFDETPFSFQTYSDVVSKNPPWDVAQCLKFSLLSTDSHPVYDETSITSPPSTEDVSVSPMVQDHSSSSAHEIHTTPVADIHRSPCSAETKRFNKTSRLPIWHKDFVTGTKSKSRQ